MLQPIARVAERGRIQTEVLPSRKCGKTPGIWDWRHGQGIKDCDPLARQTDPGGDPGDGADRETGGDIRASLPQMPFPAWLHIGK